MSSELFGTFLSIIVQGPLGEFDRLHPQVVSHTIISCTIHSRKRAKQCRRYLPVPLRYSYSMDTALPFAKQAECTLYSIQYLVYWLLLLQYRILRQETCYHCYAIYEFYIRDNTFYLAVLICYLTLSFTEK